MLNSVNWSTTGIRLKFTNEYFRKSIRSRQRGYFEYVE